MGYFSPQLIATFDEGDFGEQNWGKAARGMLGVENEDDAIRRLSQNYNISDPEQREDFFAAVREVNPAEEMRLRKEAQEYDRSLLLTEQTKQDVAKGKRASDGQIDNISNRLGNFIKSSNMDIWYPLVMGVPWSKNIKKPEMTLYNKKIKAFVDNYNIWIDSLNLSKTEAAELQNNSTKRTALLHEYAEYHGDPLAKAIANMFKKGVPNGNTLKINKDETSTETKKDEVVTPESMGLNKDDFYFHKGKNMWYYKRGPNVGKPLDKRYQFNMTAVDQENEVNSSLFGGTSYA